MVSDAPVLKNKILSASKQHSNNSCHSIMLMIIARCTKVMLVKMGRFA